MKKLRFLIRQNGISYLLAILICLTMRALGQVSDSDTLLWILAPTARWAGILSGIPFEYLPHMGYVNHFYRFLIAPSCSGIRFMSIVFLMLTFSFTHQLPSGWAKYLGLGIHAAASYLSTVFVNGIRITLAIYLPIPLGNAGLLNGWLNPDRLHTLIGTVVYFSSLCVIYPAACYLYRHSFIPSPKPCMTDSSSALQKKRQMLIPAFWYLLAVLMIPLTGRFLRNDWEGFGSYMLLIVGACAVILILTCLIHRLFTLYVSKK